MIVALYDTKMSFARNETTISEIAVNWGTEECLSVVVDVGLR